MVSREGALVGSAAYYLPSADYSDPMQIAVAGWAFEPAQEKGREVVGFLRYCVTDYFVDKERRRSGDYTPARPLWTIDRKLAARMNTLCSAREENERVVFDRIRVDFHIDANGEIKRFRGDDDLAKGLIRHFFEPARDALRFKPAMRNGAPVSCHLALYLAPEPMGDHGEKLEAQPVRPLPAHPDPGSGADSLEATVVADFDPTGIVASAQVIDEIPADFALKTILAMRAWRLSETELEANPDGVIKELRFGFLSDNSQGFLMDPPRTIELIPPIADRLLRDTFPPEMTSAFADGAVEIAYRVDEDGRFLDPEVTGTTNSKYSDWVLEDLEQLSFLPGRRDGTTMSFRMVQRVSYVVYERTQVKSDRDSTPTRIP